MDRGGSVSDVWALEDDYWRFVREGDVESYVRLWHDRFIGWPCDQEHPMRKSSVGAWVQEIRDQKIRVTTSLTREGAEDFGDTVIVHYRFAGTGTYPDGRVEGRGRELKVTHTWLRVGGTWQIIGGMCGDLGPLGE
jgi:ketosteroid isomerase-like protein